MKIGELAKKVGCSVATIRYYEKSGLITPANRDTANNYRYYSQTHLQQLTFVRHCRALAMSHEEIVELIKARQQTDEDCTSINNVIDQHLAHVANRIQELTLLKQHLNELRQQCLSSGDTKQCGIIKNLDTPAPIEKLSTTKHSHIKGTH